MQEFFQFEGDKRSSQPASEHAFKRGFQMWLRCRQPVSIYAAKVKIQTERFMQATHYHTHTHTHTREHTHILFIFFTRKCDLYEKSQQQHGSGLLRVRVKYFAAFELFKFNFQPAKE